jgi:hypothetical protein
MKSTKKIYWLFILATLILPFSCNEKENTEFTDDDIQVVEDDNLTENIIENVDNTVDDEIYQLDINGYSTTKSAEIDNICRVITIDKPDTGINKFPKVITIDFGDGCTQVINGDTITKKGKIIITVTGRYWLKGSTRTVTFENFYVNNVKIEGVRTITNNGKNEKGNWTWTIKLDSGKITFNDTAIITINSERTRELVTNNTIERSDDYFLITGSETGTTVNKIQYTKTIIDTLQKNFTCPVFVKGSIENKIGSKTFTINFGDGDCDKIITVTKDGISKTVDVKWKRKNRIKK